MRDLTDPGVRAVAGVEPVDLTGDDYTATQSLGSGAAAAGLGGILAHSAALPGRLTLAVFAAGMAQLTPGPPHVGPPPPRLADLLDTIRAHPDVPGAARASRVPCRRRQRSGPPSSPFDLSPDRGTHGDRVLRLRRRGVGPDPLWRQGRSAREVDAGPPSAHPRLRSRSAHAAAGSSVPSTRWLRAPLKVVPAVGPAF